MKTLRLLIPLIVLLVALPSYAICSICDFNCHCVGQQGAGSRCKPDIDCCFEVQTSCFSADSDDTLALAAQYTIASVDVVMPTDTEIRLARQERKPASAEKTAPAP